MSKVRVNAPDGHYWQGLEVQVVDRDGDSLATLIGTFVRRDGRFVHVVDPRVSLAVD